MLPIFNDYIKFLNDSTEGLEFLEEGYYWYDKSYIRAFTKDGELIKIARLYCTDNLTMTVKLYPNEEKLNLSNEEWDELIKEFKENNCKLF